MLAAKYSVSPAEYVKAVGIRLHVRDTGSRIVLALVLLHRRRVEPSPLLREIRAPTLLVWGERGAMIPITNAANYVGNLRQSTLVVLRGLGHVPQEEAPTRSLRPVKSFLAGAANAQSL